MNETQIRLTNQRCLGCRRPVGAGERTDAQFPKLKGWFDEPAGRVRSRHTERKLKPQAPLCNACSLWSSNHPEEIRRIIVEVDKKSTWAEAMDEYHRRMTDEAVRQPRGGKNKAGFTTGACAGCGRQIKGNPERQQWFKLPESDELRPFCAACAKWSRNAKAAQIKAIQDAIDAVGQDYARASATLLDKVSNRPGRRVKAAGAASPA